MMARQMLIAFLQGHSVSSCANQRPRLRSMQVWFLACTFRSTSGVASSKLQTSVVQEEELSSHGRIRDGSPTVNLQISYVGAGLDRRQGSRESCRGLLKA